MTQIIANTWAHGRQTTQKRAPVLVWEVSSTGCVYRSQCGRAVLEHHQGKGRTGPGPALAAQWHVTVDGEQALDRNGKPWKRRNEETAMARAVAMVAAHGPTRWERVRREARTFALRCGPLPAVVVVGQDGGGVLTVDGDTKSVRVFDLGLEDGLEDAIDVVIDEYERRRLAKRGDIR